MAIKMTSFSSKNNKDNYQNIDVCVEITDRQQLDMLIRKLESIDTVSKVIRPVK